MEEKNILTINELSILVWLKVLDDFDEATIDGEKVSSLKEKLDIFTVESADIEREEFDEAVEKFKEMALLVEVNDEMYLSDTAKQIAKEVLDEENGNITITTSIKKIAKRIYDNRDKIIRFLAKTTELAIPIILEAVI